MLVIMKNNVREIMGKYEKAVEKIDRKYNVSKVKNNEKEILEKIEYEKKFIEKLKSEGKEINKDLIAKAEGRLEELLLKQVENDDKRNKREDALLEKATSKEQKVKCQYLYAHCLRHLGEDLNQAYSIFTSLANDTDFKNDKIRIRSIYSATSIKMFQGDSSYPYEKSFERLFSRYLDCG